MTVRSDRLAGPLSLPASLTTIVFTVPAAQTYLVKFLSLANAGAVASLCYVRVRISGTAAVIHQVSVPAVGSSVVTFPVIALDAGCILDVVVGLSPVVILVTGTKLAGVAP